MAHKILVLSPLHNMGASCVATMIAHGMTFDGKSTTLLYTDVACPISDYLGIETVNDPTRSIMQMIRLVDSGALEDNDILDYMYNYAKNAWLMNATDTSLTSDNMAQVVTHAFRRAPTDLAICDCSNSLNEPITSQLIDVADLVLLVTDMSPKGIKFAQNWMNDESLKAKPEVYTIVNRYDETIMAVKNFAKKLGVTANRVGKIHYNPWITKCCFTGSLKDVLPLSRTLDPRVAALNTDINDFMVAINSSILLKAKGR